jgi:hypothetical protein
VTEVTTRYDETVATSRERFDMQGFLGVARVAS